MIRVYETHQNRQLIFQSSPKNQHEHTCYQEAVRKCKYYLNVSHPVAILEDIARRADDPLIDNSAISTSARELIHLVFKASGLEMEHVETDKYAKDQEEWVYRYEFEAPMAKGRK